MNPAHDLIKLVDQIAYSPTQEQVDFLSFAIQKLYETNPEQMAEFQIWYYYSKAYPGDLDYIRKALSYFKPSKIQK